MVGIISVVIGGHFGGRDHFDGGDHFGGGTGSHWISKEYDLHVVSLGFLSQIFLRNDFDLFYCLFYFLRGTFAAVVSSSSFVGKECQSKFKEITMRVPSVKCFQSLFLFDIYSFFSFIFDLSIDCFIHLNIKKLWRRKNPFASCKGIRILECKKFLLVEARI